MDPLSRRLIEKGVGIVRESKLSPRFQAPFSVCFANPRSTAPRTAALVTCAKGFAAFSAEKTSGKGTPLRRRNSEVPLVSPQRNGDPPRALLHKKSAGPDGCAVRAREARRKRERRPSGRACSHPWNPLSFSISLPKQVTPKTAFRMGFREGLWAPKPPP